MREYMVTTVDNPFNPFTEWDEWFAYDRSLGHHTPSLLARVGKVSSELSEIDQVLAINDAVEEIVELNTSGLYRKVVRGEE